MKNFKNKIKVIFIFVLGLLLVGSGVAAATVVSSSSISYSNSSSGLSATNVQSALDELTEKAQNVNSKNNIVIAYNYNSSSCITGDESTCTVSTCYKNKIANSCSAGTIIKYRVNSREIKTFYVLHDDGSKMTIVQRENTVSNIKWYSEGDNTKGPTVAFTELDKATQSWINIGNQTYTVNNTYTLTRTSKARMATAVELKNVGCNTTSCPVWLFNFTAGCSQYGCSNEDYVGSEYPIFTIDGASIDSGMCVAIYGQGFVSYTYVHGIGNVRAVVEITK